MVKDWSAQLLRTIKGRAAGLPWRRIGIAFVMAAALVAVVPPFRRAATFGTSRVILWLASPITPFVPNFERLPDTTRVLAADGSELAALSGEDGRRQVLELDAIPEHVRRAVLAAEDADFYHHSGTNPLAMTRAMARTALGHTQGGSTITQQLAKLNYTGNQRSLFRKVREVLYASALETRYSKDDLLRRYLNQVYFGQGSYGIHSAAHTFFGVDPAQLTSAQAATLAGKIRAPSALDPRRDPTVVQERRDDVLRAMAGHGWLSGHELDAALAEPMTIAPPQPPGVTRAPHFIDYLKREASDLEELGDDADTRRTRLLTGGYTVETTLDPKLFDATTAAVLARLGEPGDPITAVASVVPGDGAVANLFGGLDYLATQFGYADRGLRQAGSAFKPFVYLAALRDGIDPRSVFDGRSGRHIPCYGDRPVNNYAGEDSGSAIDVNAALARSVNVVFVDLGCQVGVRDVERAATDAGIPGDATEAQGAIFLGGLDRGVSPLSMAAAYATFASGGVYAEPYGIKRILDSRGDVVYEHRRRTQRAFDAAHVGVLNGAMQRVIGEGTGRAAGLGRPAAGKTGTTEENVDAWFVGYVPQASTAVWVGYDPARPMTDVHRRTVTGGSFPAAIFGDLMRTGLDGTPVRRLPVASPDGLGLQRLGELPPPPLPPAAPLPPMSPPPSAGTEPVTLPVTPGPQVPPAPAPTPTPSTTPTDNDDDEETANDEFDDDDQPAAHDQHHERVHHDDRAGFGLRWRSAAEPFGQPPGVEDGVALVVVVEVGVDVAAGVPPSGQAVGRATQAAAGVPAPVFAVLGVGAVEADVGPVGGQLPRVVGQHVVEAQRRAVAAEDLERVVVQPRRLPQLHRPAEVAGQAVGLGEELVEPLGVAPPAGWQLHQCRPQRRAEPPGPVEVVRQPGDGVAELHAVGAELAELDGVQESGRRGRGPRLRRLRRGQPVEGRVELHRVEQRRVVGEPPLGGELLRVHDATPVAVEPPRATHPNPTPGHTGQSAQPASVVAGDPAGLHFRSMALLRRGRDREPVVLPYFAHQIIEYFAALYLLQVGVSLKGTASTVGYVAGGLMLLGTALSGKPLGGGRLSRRQHRVVDIALIAGIAVSPFVFGFSDDARAVVRLEAIVVALALLCKATLYGYMEVKSSREIAQDLKDHGPRLAGRMVGRRVANKRRTRGPS